MDFETTMRRLSSDYPGFPPFVHHIMAKYEMGQTQDDIVAELKAAGVRDAIDNLILNTEKTHATYVGKDVVLPPKVLSRVEENNKCLANMILSANNKIQEEIDLENGVSRGDEGVS